MKPRHARRVPEYLQHILDAIDRAAAYVAGMDLGTFERDTRTQDAVADPEFAARFTEVPWDVIYGMRNRIVHDYFEVDLEIVWQTVQQDLPPLRRQIAKLLDHANEA